MPLREDVLAITSGEFGQLCTYRPARGGSFTLNAVIGDIITDSLGDDQRGIKNTDATVGHVEEFKTALPQIGDLLTDATGHTYSVERVVTTNFGKDINGVPQPVVHVLDLVSA